MENKFKLLGIDVKKQEHGTLIFFPDSGFIDIQSQNITLKESDDDSGAFFLNHEEFNTLIIEIVICDNHEQVRLHFKNNTYLEPLDFNINDTFSEEDTPVELIFSKLLNFVKDEAVRLSRINEKNEMFGFK